MIGSWVGLLAFPDLSPSPLNPHHSTPIPFPLSHFSKFSHHPPSPLFPLLLSSSSSSAQNHPRPLRRHTHRKHIHPPLLMSPHLPNVVLSNQLRQHELQHGGGEEAAGTGVAAGAEAEKGGGGGGH